MGRSGAVVGVVQGLVLYGILVLPLGRSGSLRSGTSRSLGPDLRRLSLPEVRPMSGLRSHSRSRSTGMTRSLRGRITFAYGPVPPTPEATPQSTCSGVSETVYKDVEEPLKRYFTPRQGFKCYR